MKQLNNYRKMRTVCILLYLCLLNGISFAQNGIDSVLIKTHLIPLLTESTNNFAFTLKIYVKPGSEGLFFRSVRLSVDQPGLLRKVKIVGTEYFNKPYLGNGSESQFLTMGSENPDNEMIIHGNLLLKDGENTFYVSLLPALKANLSSAVRVTVHGIGINDFPENVTANATGIFRLGRIVRSAGQDMVHTYRIPGLVTTEKGTLIAVYDNRYNNQRDLQEDIDVGMSRSTDGGQTWEPMKVILDMGEYGGLSDSRNGVGDPAILVDRSNNTLWVAALWIHGNYASVQNNHFKQQGLEPMPDGSGSQVVLVKSTDDGITWSEPVNITRMVKDTRWDRFLQGPGMGITMSDGTLVFAGQFLDPENGMQSASNIFYSNDHGKTWKTGSGSIPGGGEAQVAEISDGKLMMNMRSTIKARLVAVSDDLGESWELHPTSGKALQESGCMASFIATDLDINGKKQRVLFFSNPDNTDGRTNMTIKASVDGGKTWPESFQLEINEKSGFGYSCLTMVDDKTIGILYEGVKDLIFQKIPVSEIIRD